MRKLPVVVLLITILLLFPLLISKTTYLTLKNPADSSFYLVIPIEHLDSFTLRWRHSVELQPWEEKFQANINTMIFTLIETRFRSYGAGVPANTSGNCALIDGYIVYQNLSSPYTELPFINSHYAKYCLYNKDKEYRLFELIPDNSKVILSLMKLSRLKYWQLKSG